jgi:hypothetical protein
MQRRRSFFALFFTLLGYLGACERAANSTPNRPPVEPSPVAAKTSSSTPDSSERQPVVALVIGDTSTSSKLPSAAVVEGNPEPTVPMIVKDVCPGEFCEFGEWLACDSIAVYSEARATSPIALFLGRGDRFTAVTGDVHIAQAGKVVFRRNVRVTQEGMNFLFTPADTLYPLWYSGESFGDWYFRGKQASGVFFFGDGSHPDEEGPSPDADWELVRAMRNEWWVKVRNSKEQQGWIVPDFKRVRGTTTQGIAAECTPLAKE